MEKVIENCRVRIDDRGVAYVDSSINGHTLMRINGIGRSIVKKFFTLLGGHVEVSNGPMRNVFVDAHALGTASTYCPRCGKYFAPADVCPFCKHDLTSDPRLKR